MKTRLEKKEIFIPLAGGADTSGDPRAPKSPTVTAENVDFNIDNIARPRDALATFVGNSSADTPSSISNTYAMFKSGSSIVVGGNSFFEISNCAAQPTSFHNRYGSCGIAGVYDYEAIKISNGEDTIKGDAIISNTASNGIQCIFRENSSGYVGCVDINTGISPASISVAADPFYVNATGAVYMIGYASSNWSTYTWDGNAGTNIGTVAASSGTRPTGKYLSQYHSTNTVVVTGINGTANGFCTVVNFAAPSVSGSYVVAASGNFTHADSEVVGTNVACAFLGMANTTHGELVVTLINSTASSVATNTLTLASSLGTKGVFISPTNSTDGYVAVFRWVDPSYGYIGVIMGMYTYSISGSTLTISSAMTGSGTPRNIVPVSRPWREGSSILFWGADQGGRWYDSTNETSFEAATPQTYLRLFKFSEYTYSTTGVL